METSLNNRFYCIRSKRNYYVYDKYLNSINKIDSDLFIKFNNDLSALESQYIGKQNKSLSFFKQQKPVITYHSDKKCYVSINLSSSCNMTCSYCFKTKQHKIQKNVLSDIFKYVTEVYYPNAKEYIFSVGYSSEPLEDLESIDFLDELIAKKEGFLFKEEDFLFVTPKEVLQKLLDICKIKSCYWIREDFSIIESINSIIENIDINNFMDENFLSTIDSFYYNYISMSKKFCKSKRVQINRRIIERLFYGKIQIFDYKQYYTICFMTNGLAISTDIIQYFKSRFLKSICISLDGNKQIHNTYRKTLKKEGSYDIIVKNIRLLQENRIDVYVSCVITPDYLNLIDIFEHFLSLRIKKIDFHYVRSGNKYKGFTEESIEKLNHEVNKLYKRLQNDLKTSDYRLFLALKDSLLFFFFKIIVKRQFNITRCKWGDEIIFDTDGHIYPCQYMLNFPNQSIFHYSDGKNHTEIIKPIFSNELDLCKSCWAEYICGGTCHYNSFINEGDLYKTNRIECKYNKNLIINSLDFCIFLIENNLYGKVASLI